MKGAAGIRCNGKQAMSSFTDPRAAGRNDPAPGERPGEQPGQAMQDDPSGTGPAIAPAAGREPGSAPGQAIAPAGGTVFRDWASI